MTIRIRDDPCHGYEVEQGEVHHTNQTDRMNKRDEPVLTCPARHSCYGSWMLKDCFSILLGVQDDTKEGAVHVDVTIVFQEAQLPELIHEETHP